LTPLERAARDRTNAFLDAMHSSADTIVTLKRGDALIPLKGSDLLLLLAALDRHEQHAEPSGQCEDCSCCIASGCHPGPGSTCPTDRLGDSVCPCTGE